MSSLPSIQDLKSHCSPRAVWTASPTISMSLQVKSPNLTGLSRFILSFWNDVNIAVSKIMSSNLMLSPNICLFQGINELTHKAHLRKFLHLSVLAARRNIVKYWNFDKPCSFRKLDCKYFQFSLTKLGIIVEERLEFRFLFVSRLLKNSEQVLPLKT